MRDRQAIDLFLVSWLVLFLELACIRWFPSHVLYLTFFTNTVLLASFVGMSIGCLVARSKGNFIRGTPVWLAVAILAGLLIDGFAHKLQHYFAVGNQASPDVIYFGTETSAMKEKSFTVPIEAIGGLFFVMIAAILVGPGQEMGRAFNRVPNRTTAYSANLLGSLAGIGSFAACSYLKLPPIVWFALVAVGLAYFLMRNRAADPPPAGTPDPTRMPLMLLAITVLITGWTSGFFSPKPYPQQTTWSPYYRIDHVPPNKSFPNHYIFTNLISHQLMEPVDQPTVAPYAMPYLFQRDVKNADGSSAWPAFKRVLIIGAGSGNDVARALRWCPPDAKIDAVEIDPVIQSLGVKHHPDKPFEDKRVTVHLNDGRNFLRKAPDGEYDLVIFALIDSLVLQSGYSNLRLESYLFTLDSFKDVRRVMKPTGVYAVYNFLRLGWLAARIREQLRTAFSNDPVAFALQNTQPAECRDTVELNLFDNDGFTIFFAGAPAVLDPLKAAFAAGGGSYWYPWNVGVPTDSAAKFGKDAPKDPPPVLNNFARTYKVGDTEVALPPSWVRLKTARIEDSNGKLRPATDDWPFLYTREPQVPALTIRGVVLTLVLSLGLWLGFGGRSALGGETGTPEYGFMLRSFLLGAGFMLVETKAVVQMALLFGGTWMVNTVVFAAILVMALVGNFSAGIVKPKRLEPYYAGLLLTLAVGLAIPMDAFLGMAPVAQIAGACALAFAPIAFAGVIFATTFRRTSQPDRLIGANVAGALVGGLAENTSVILGFQYLLCVAVGFYLLSAAFGNRSVPASEAKPGV